MLNQSHDTRPDPLQPPPCLRRYSWLSYDGVQFKGMNLNNYLNYKSSIIFQESGSPGRTAAEKSFRRVNL